MRRWVADWGERAEVDSVGYRLVRAFRLKVRERAFAPLIVACLQADLRFDYLDQAARGTAVATGHPTATASARSSLSRLAGAAAGRGGRDAGGTDRRRSAIGKKSWGDQNSIHIQHPFSRILPWLSGWLDMPTRALPGDLYMPRVQTPDNGSSERLVVAPGREANGILHMPGGQSGHPLSPFYRAGFDAWADGRPLPLLPGPARHRLTLTPESLRPESRVRSE
jgi:penicillin amidase